MEEVKKRKKVKEEKEKKDAILINKMCTGSYPINNIGHEIINYFEDDENRKVFYYILPYGKYNNKDYNIKKVILTTKLSNKRVGILAIADVKIEFEIDGEKEDVHKEQVKKLENVKYNGKKLKDIFVNNKGNETAIYVSFEVENILEPKEKLYISNNINDKNKKEAIIVKHNIPSSSLKGYFIDEDYNKILRFIEKNNELFEKYQPISLKGKNNNLEIENEINFLQLIDKENEEQIYTNLIYYWFGRNNLFETFIQSKNLIHFLDKYNLYKEKKLEHGRMDILAISEREDKAIIIENKILSGLNGIDKAKENNQLKTYLNAIKNKYEAKISLDNIFGLVFVPDYNYNFIKQEMEEVLTKKEIQYFEIVKYSELYKFFADNQNKVKEDLYYKNYYQEFLNILKIHTCNDINEKNKKEMERKFLYAIKNAKN